MAPIDYDEDAEDDSQKYHESSDEDFNPDTAPIEEVSSDEDEDEDDAVAVAVSTPAQRKGKRKAPADDELDSGDEVTIHAARTRAAKRRKKQDTKGNDDDDDDVILSDDEGGEGGLVKTRAQRRGEQKERRPLARTEGATVDVDALWAQMIAAPLKPVQPVTPEATAALKNQAAPTVARAPGAVEEEQQVAVKKIYTFAGQDTTEEKQVPRSQLEKYLLDGWKPLDAPSQLAEQPTETPPADHPSKPAQPSIRRPLRRPSRFDPNPTGFVRALAPEHQLSWPRRKSAASPSLEQDKVQVPAPPEEPKARVVVEKAPQKLNVVDKSRMDWTGFVDKEGIAEELDTHGKTKEAYLGRMEFLAGVEARREDERLKMKTAASVAASAAAAAAAATMTS